MRVMLPKGPLVCARWNSSSSRISASSRLGRNKFRNLRNMMRLLREIEKGGDGARVPSPGFDLLRQTFFAGFGQRVVARPPVILAGFPFGSDEPGSLQAMKSGIERAFFYPELVIRRKEDVAGDAVTVFRPPRQRLQDEEVERALEGVSGHEGISPRRLG